MSQVYTPSIHHVSYKVDGGQLQDAVVDGDWWALPFESKSGYAIVSVWVYDLAGNSTHDTYWFWLEGGVVKSIQPVADGKYRVNMLKDWHTSLIPYGFRVCGLKLYYSATQIPGEQYNITKIKDQKVSI